MSSEKKLSDILREEIDNLRKKVEALERQKTTSTAEQDHTAMPEAPKGHKTIDEVADCPNCRPRLVERLRPIILKEYGESLKGKSIVKCKTCGLHVDQEETKCPGCGGTESE